MRGKLSRGLSTEIQLSKFTFFYVMPLKILHLWWWIITIPFVIKWATKEQYHSTRSRKHIVCLCVCVLSVWGGGSESPRQNNCDHPASSCGVQLSKWVSDLRYHNTVPPLRLRHQCQSNTALSWVHMSFPFFTLPTRHLHKFYQLFLRFHRLSK